LLAPAALYFVKLVAFAERPPTTKGGIINRVACIAYRKKGIPARRSLDHPPRRPVSAEHLSPPTTKLGDGN
jgi:hypothetical protein